jgi:hypothetical protein
MVRVFEGVLIFKVYSSLKLFLPSLLREGGNPEVNTDISHP